MKPKTSVMMAVLTLMAIVLGVILLATPPREAKGEMLNAQSGYNMMMTGLPGGEEFLVIVDNTTQKMLVYRMQGTTLDLVSGSNFGPWFANPTAPAAPGRSGAR
jgi:hypothetical protein